tara:strand:- start:1292 stop:2152 length:861 start_codon:yes stop_codon:yes gene_type:complete
MSIILTDRADRLGSNWFVKIADFIYGKNINAEILYNSSIKFSSSMFTIPFLKLCKLNINNNETKNEIIQLNVGIRGHPAGTVIKIKQDLISYFKENYKDDFMKIIENIASKRNYRLPWENSNNIIAIHLRCDDKTELEDYDGSGTANYIKNLIETNTFNAYNRKTMKSKGRDEQVCIDEIKLEKLIKKFKNHHPNKEIHIIYCGKPNDSIQNIIKKYNIITHSNKDADYDLWLLMNSNILVLSKSTYSILAGYFHKGSQVYYPLWGVFVSCGLYTKYDKSNWIKYI